MAVFPRITFGVIVLNGEPFTKYCLRSLYPFAHEIIVVEGASKAAKNISTPDGHSRDETLEILHSFKKEEDPDNKLVIITAEDKGHPNGFWPGEKDEQSRAYAELATGDYLWQVDIDEFYRPEDMKIVIEMLREDPEITAVSFKQITFWGATNYVVDGWYLKNGADIYHRLFKWGPGYQYATHRPPTVLDSSGHDLRRLKWIGGQELYERGVLMYHYSLLFPKQVFEKCDYYSNADWTDRKKATWWAEKVYMKLERPFRVHNVYEFPGWLERYPGKHPSQVVAMCEDIRSGALSITIRHTDDIERLLNSSIYKIGRSFLKISSPIQVIIRSRWNKWKQRVLRVFRDPKGSIKTLVQKIFKSFQKG